MTTFEPAPRTVPRAPAAQVGRCAICGNEYENGLQIIYDGATHGFDCFECAIHALVSSCDRCGCRVIGHGIQVRGTLYCSLHCAESDS